MTARRAPSKSIVTSSAEVLLTRPAYTASASDFEPPPSAIAPTSALISERFIALHMMRVRMMPDAPTSEPVMIRMLLLRTKPVDAAASPEYELSSAMATGMSAPPIGIVSSTPRTDATAMSPA